MVCLIIMSIRHFFFPINLYISDQQLIAIHYIRLLWKKDNQLLSLPSQNFFPLHLFTFIYLFIVEFKCCLFNSQNLFSNDFFFFFLTLRTQLLRSYSALWNYLLCLMRPTCNWDMNLMQDFSQAAKQNSPSARLNAINLTVSVSNDLSSSSPFVWDGTKGHLFPS